MTTTEAFKESSEEIIKEYLCGREFLVQVGFAINDEIYHNP